MKKKLIALYKLKKIDSQIDKIRTIKVNYLLKFNRRPMWWLETRINKCVEKSEITRDTRQGNCHKRCNTLIKRYESTKQRKKQPRIEALSKGELPK